MLKMTKIELGKISDPDKYMFFEHGIRGVLVTLIKFTVKRLKMSIYFIWT